MLPVLEAGYRALLSNNNLWYLDHLDVTWQEMYDNDPFSIDEKQKINNTTLQALVLGGEACMWAETVDASNLEATVWPRATAVAERLWSEGPVNMTGSSAGVEERMQAFRCPLLRRGVGVAPLTNSVARTVPSGPGGCRQ